MYGITLPRMSMEGTPGYPAPEMACMVLTITLVMPNCLSGPSAITRPTVEQFGLVTICPFHPRARCWPGTSLRRSEEDTSELQSHRHLVCRLLLEKNNT